MLNNEHCKLIVKYQVMDIDGQPQCMTQQVLPEGLRMQEYELKFNPSERRIYTVIHREYGPVQFVANKIDEESTYVLGSRMNIYTTLIQ